MKPIISDKWLSKIIGKPTFFLQKPIYKIIKNDFPKTEVFIWTKISVLNSEKLLRLQQNGFYIVDTNIQLKLNSLVHKKKNSKIRFALKSDEKEVRKIARKSFSFSRFHLDYQIPNSIASKIKEEWAGNYFLGNRGKWMIVAEHNSEIIGFLQLLKKNNKTIVIDLIAVDERYRGKGFANKMISYAYSNCLNKISNMEVGTQISNLSSLNLYTKLGFRVVSSSYVLHSHKKF